MGRQGGTGSIKFPLWGMFLIALFAVITAAKAFFLPVVLALLLSLTFSPVVRSLRRRGVPEAVSAGLLVLIGALLFALFVSFLAEPFTRWVEKFPSQFVELKYKLSGLIDKMAELEDATLSLSESAPVENEQTLVNTPKEGNGLVLMAANNVLAMATTTLVTMVLSYFLLAKGRIFYSKVLERFSTLQDKKEVLTTVYTIERMISRYLLAITLINILLGMAIALAMWIVDMPSPLLWGMAATILNFLPYIGAVMGIIASSVVAILTFDSIGVALLVPAAYAALTGVEGQLITPSYIGKSLSINPVIVFLSVAMWSFMWGLAGALIAVPLLVVIHTIALNVENMSWFSRFVSDYEDAEDDQE